MTSMGHRTASHHGLGLHSQTYSLLCMQLKGKWGTESAYLDIFEILYLMHTFTGLSDSLGHLTWLEWYG